ncbi:hypothetical protein SAMN05421823_101213 [Catalinimonas alkaloidigena]|uniref:Uncharacterized protein n=1 Tax=Catalinimonas alkaloidigena TaxID=1075417 RepID=A0A1G8WY44_9BACT|nr:hypothetical protein [Catalinimonas alkaloidigena]SDJ83134.1 hypothetical protein SAMN05421823_101213 [Catalinimonas alkaloidigena]
MCAASFFLAQLTFEVNVLYLFLILLGIGAGGLATYFYFRYQSQKASPQSPHTHFDHFYNPIFIVAMIIILSVLVLIGANLFGMDRGDILHNLAGGAYARGLITYLFAVGTIGLIVLLILAALIDTGKDDQRSEQIFNRAKEVLTILIGIFGTIIGYYFGAAPLSQDAAASLPLLLNVPQVPDSVGVGEVLEIEVEAYGGAPPYVLTIDLLPFPGHEWKKVISAAGEALEAQVRVPTGATGAYLDAVLYLEDAREDSVTNKITVKLHPAARDTLP